MTGQKSRLREYVEAFLIAIVLALFVRTFVVQAFKIPSGSMIPTLMVGDHILVNKFVFGVKLPFTTLTLIPVSEPDRGDIIVFRYPQDESKDFIKRVVGLPGDRVEIRHQQVYIDDQPLIESYAVHQDGGGFGPASPRDEYGPVTVPRDSYFVMGDNRDHSLDSRFWGFVKADKIKGRAFLIYWSWDGAERWVRWERLGKVVD
ncbi:MAG: signal peptidase I [Nitrospirota bacterium]